MQETFHKVAARVSNVAGSPQAFIVSILIIVCWGFSGSFFSYSDTWQLVINTGTTIVTFLMVFLIQNTQNRDARALHLKLDEMIRATKGARNTVVDIEEMSDSELTSLHIEFQELHQKAAQILERRKLLKSNT